jgi:hypothetical protein
MTTAPCCAVLGGLAIVVSIVLAVALALVVGYAMG